VIDTYICAHIYIKIIEMEKDLLVCNDLFYKVPGLKNQGISFVLVSSYR